MDMRLIKESIQLDQPAARAQGQLTAEGEITLPGGLREEARVLHAGGMAVIDRVECMQERAAVTGKVIFHALYTQGDHTRVNGIEATADFTHMLDMPGLQPRCLCHVEAAVEHVDAAAANGRLSLRGIVGLTGSAVSQAPVDAVTGVHGLEHVESRASEVAVKRTVASGEGEMLLREELALNQEVRETLYATAWARVTGVTGGMGRAGVQGEVELEAVHATDEQGRPVIITRHTIPFEHTVELTGENGDALQGRAVVRDVAVASQAGPEGGSILRAEVVLGVNAWADRTERITLLQDAYTTCDEDLRLTTREVLVRTEDHAASAAESGKTMLMLPEGSPAVRGTLCAFASPVLTGREQVGGRLTVEGVMEVSLLYMTDSSDAPVAVFQEEPFRMTFAAQAAPEDQLALRCTEVEVNAITSDRVEMKYIMHLNISGVQTEQALLVTDALPVAAQTPEESIVLYFTQPGESLWDIARRYRVPAKELQELNPELEGEPVPGQGVVVWRRG